MNKKNSLLVILTVAAIMTIGAIAPAIAGLLLTELEQESLDKVNEAVDTFDEKVEKEGQIVQEAMDKVNESMTTFDEKVENERQAVCDVVGNEFLILVDKGERVIDPIRDIRDDFGCTFPPVP